MTREEKQKAIDALKISAPVKAVTQEEFNDYIQTLNQVMDWLEQESKTGHCEDCKHFRILPYHIDILGKCICHTGLCPKGDWYCADYEPQEGANE